MRARHLCDRRHSVGPLTVVFWRYRHTGDSHEVICSTNRFRRLDGQNCRAQADNHSMTFPDTHLMTSNFANDPAKPDENPQPDHEREFDRWRTAVELIQRMREAGIGCDLFDGSQNRH